MDLLISNKVLDCGNPTSNLTTQGKKYASNSAPSLTVFSVQTLIICDKGFIFIDMTVVNPSICEPSGKWSVTAECICIENSYFFLYYYLFNCHIKYLGSFCQFE